ncbi:MAG: terpene cyclase/mutase family protein [Anaerolineae bacterium]|nr:terpene cyclase/mutase family protein [Anaerolineae bacterium]
MTRLLFAILIVGVLLTVAVLPASAIDPVETALGYLAAQQQADGGFTNGFSAGSDLGTTCDVILAIAAAGQDPSDWRSAGGYSPLDYLASQVASGAADTVGLQAKVALALRATGLDPADFAGRDLVAELEAAYDGTTGSYGSNVVDQALAMLALFHAGRPVPDPAAQYLLANQTTDGAWALFGGTAAATGDTNTTALAIQALLVTGHRDEIGAAFAYLQRVQNDDGGFPYQSPSAYGTDTDANSTAYVYQALLAAGEPMVNWTPAGVDPLGALGNLYDPDSGAFFWQGALPFPNVLATAQAIPALRGYSFVELPRVSLASPPAAAPAPVLLPASGGLSSLPLLALVGAAMLGAGLVLSRRSW